MDVIGTTEVTLEHEGATSVHTVGVAVNGQLGEAPLEPVSLNLTVTVIPEEGELSRIAKELLAVANHPYEVQTVSHPHKAFRVPEDLFARFQAAQKEAAEQVAAEPVQPVAPKRRGRPRKVVVAEDKPEMVVPLADPERAAEVLTGAASEEEGEEL